jgi:hypothetical protein
MADTQQAPHPATQPLPHAPGSTREAQEALLGLLEPEEENPKKEEAQPTEEEESTEESEDVEDSTEPEEAPEEESEEEEEDSEESDEEEETEEEESEPGVYTVKINGEDHEVTADELIKGYSRQSDYTRKTQELSEYRKQLDGAAEYYQNEIAQTQQARQHYVDSVANAIQANYAGLQKFADTDWEKLKTEDREEYLIRRDQYREAQDHIGNLQQQQNQVQQEQQAEFEQQHAKVVREEYSKMVNILPEWGDPAKRKEIASEVKSFAFSKGYSQEELSQLVDHRSILVLMQAKAWEDDQKRINSIKKKNKNKPKVVKSGKGVESSDTNKKKRNKEMKRLKETGHVRDASVLFEDFVEL